MTPRTLRRASVFSVLLAGAVVHWCGGCSGETSDGNAEPDAAAAGDAGMDATDAEPWDPVWHETDPKQWPTTTGSDLPDCGPGCRMAIARPIRELTDFMHAYTPDLVAAELRDVTSNDYSGVGWAAPDSSTTSVAEEGETIAILSLAGSRLAYLRATDPTNSKLEVMDLKTGEKKVVHSYTRFGTNPDTVFTLALNERYLFWEMFKPAGLWARNLETGEIKKLATGPWSCNFMSATESLLVCPAVDKGQIYVIDPETAEATKLDPGAGLQIEGYLSPDRQRLAWIDYRDPPGQDSTYYFKRSGGEIYSHDFATGETTRLTYDSPTSPRGKTQPAIGTDRAVWSEPWKDKPQNPDSFDEIRGVATAISVLKLDTGERCRLEMTLGPKSIHGHHVYARWLDRSTNKQWLIDLDLDDPGLNWECGYAPAAPSASP